MISIVEDIDKVCKERVNLLKLKESRRSHFQARKLINNGLKLFNGILLSEFHFSHIESLNSLDLETKQVNPLSHLLTQDAQPLVSFSVSLRE